ncbi:Similar to Peroxisomal membrane protein PEX29; acc. no. Q03370 [Pyronema omphalodes CBS 100304]|uniref:Similar to Peroxisomal membrane protein PEX29 acc. no. Q03370 n=1 Tax=Pyronema omphalodes (strain CBS 100304) TaxID=1076935 RepID=U4L907_PYROM|nr:Similar to Peroxisomal membrane protein PEX29; acc. no. Q03370 [Pyronema omphalodes CBS 100304]
MEETLAQVAAHHQRRSLRSSLSESLGLPSNTLHSHHRSISSSSTSDMADLDNPSLSTTMQERLFSRLLTSILPTDFAITDNGLNDPRSNDTRPSFAITTMSHNFRRFNSRIGIVFIFQHKLLRLLSWKNPVHTASLGVVYGFICLDPYLLFALPPIIALLGILVPGFIARHPPPPPAPSSSAVSPGGQHASQAVYSAHGPAIAPPSEIKAVSEISKDFFRNLRDLQNTMDDFSNAHDLLIGAIGPPTNFSDEKLSSGVFLACLVGSVGMMISAHLLPWRIIFLIVGWMGLGAMHPGVREIMVDLHNEHLAPREKKAAGVADSWVHSDICLSTTREMREVEIFELQRRIGGGGQGEDFEYEGWLFSDLPYEPLSPARIAEEKPKGARFLEDVRPPQGWEWGEGKWSLDLGAEEWVADRCLGGVEVEGEGERWVFDWDNNGRGEWRRRRWVRGVRRKYLMDQ